MKATGINARWALAAGVAFAVAPRLFAEEVDDAKTVPQNVFATPILSPMPEKTWGEPAVAWHNGEYFLIYDFPTGINGPLCLMSSKEGVYWREESPALNGDEDSTAMACPDIRRFQPDGPFVMNYDVLVPKKQWQTRFATSSDLRHWNKVDGISLVRDPALYRDGSYVHYSIPAADDNGFYAIGAYTPATHFGTGLLRSRDGINWEQLPGPRVEGVIDQQGGLNPGPGWKALESSAIVHLADRYFILGGNPHTGSDVIVTSKDIRGPYHPTPKNHLLLRTPQNFQRVYDLPGGWLSMPMVWAQRDRKYYHVAPFRRVVSDGESLWFKWWEGNEKLKVHTLVASLASPDKATPPLRMLGGGFGLSKGLVFEASVSLGAMPEREVNWARAARISADNFYTKPWWPERYFSPEKALDDKETTSWKGHRTADATTCRFALDLGAVRAIGRIRIKWQPPSPEVILQYSVDQQSWQTVASTPLRLNHGVWVWENLNLSAQQIRMELAVPPRKNAKPDDQIVGISEIEVLTDPHEQIDAAASGLFLETKPGEGWAWLVEPTGRVRFGQLSDGCTRFRCLRTRDLEVGFGGEAALRILMRDDLVDLYVNDYQVDYYQLTGGGLSGRIGLFSAADSEPGHPPKAWTPDPTRGTKQ